MGMPTALRGLDPSAKTAQLVLQADGLTKHYGPVIALERLDLGLNAGEVLGYLGPNGAGKTTTIRLLLGLIRPTAGRARIFGMDTDRKSTRLNSSHLVISYAVFCLKKKKKQQ